MEKRERAKNNIIRIILLFVFVCLILWLRVIDLDSDVPNWNLSMYTPTDEGHYAMQAIRLARPELVKQVEALGTENLKEYNSALCFLLTLFTTISMKIFGNNYYGMRMGTVVAGIILAIIVLKIIWDYINEKERNSAVLFASIIMAANFSFLLATRIVEPSIFRSLLIILIGARVFAERNKTKNFLVLGALTVLGVIWGYVTNIFIFIPSVVLLIEETINKEGKGKKEWLNFTIGAAIAFILGEGVMYAVQRRTFLQDTIRAAFGHEKNRITMSAAQVFENVKEIFKSNLFAYNIVFSALSIMGVIYCLYTGVKDKCRQKLWLGTTAAAFLLQGLFTSDFMYRKIVVIFPILLLCIVILLVEGKVLEQRKYMITFAAFALLPGIYGAYKRIGGLAYSDMTDDVKVLICSVLVVSCILMLAGFAFKKKLMIFFMASAIILPDLCMDYCYVVNADKTEKRAMTELGEIVGNNYVLGMGYGYCLYNDIIPASNVYDFYFEDEYIKRNQMLVGTQKVTWCLTYQGTEYIDNYLEGTEFKWRLKKRFYTDYNVTPGEEEIYDMYLYELEEK